MAKTILFLIILLSNPHYIIPKGIFVKYFYSV